MTKKIFLLFICCLGVVNWSYSQGGFVENKIPKEQVYLHVNSSLLLSGEKLLYKFYCLNAESNRLSNLSKIGWVTLVNSNKEEVFQHKLNLKDGQAYSDFFIPSDLPSGAYKILGYTSWMQNAQENYFKQDIHIINPYQNKNKELNITESQEALMQNVQTDTSSYLTLGLNKDTFSTREEVLMTFKNSSEIEGSFSISVRRIDSLKKPDRQKSIDFTKQYDFTRWNFSKGLILPRVRGSIIFGKVTGQVSSKNLLISFPGEENQFNIVSVSENGEFNFTVKEGLDVNKVLIQVAGLEQDDFSVELYENVKPDYTRLDFDYPVIHKGLKDYILKRSVNNQIENAYSVTKADQSSFVTDKEYFFDGELIKYDLDDYKRFPEVSETFVEIIKYGQIKRNADDTQSIFVRNIRTIGNVRLPALLIVDGVVVQNHDKLLSFDAEKIQSIGILKNKMFFGPETFQGVVVVETKDGDFPEEFQEAYIKSAKIITAQNTKQYYSPDYKNEDLDRIPDYRDQLWWNPDVSFANKNSYSFFTSDVSGTFEIELEGFTKEGKPVSINKIFSVD